MSGQKINVFGWFLVLITIIGTVILPSIEVSAALPKIEISDVTFPLLLLTLLFCRRQTIESFLTYRNIFLSLLLIVLIAVISILYNGRFGVYRDWFEPIKYFKLIILLLAFVTFIDLGKLRLMMTGVFVFLVLFNVLHFFNVFSFNEWLEIYYAPSHHLDYFGLNSLGQPSIKRMLGTLGNPNNNAILFLLFLVFFLPEKKDKFGLNHVLSYISIIGVLACQSRTGFITLLVLMLGYVFYARIQFRYILPYVGLILVGFWAMKFEGNSYLSSLGDKELLTSAKKGRLDQWKAILATMPQHWLLGHGVNKAFFEKNGIYAESEYFLVLFRFGIIGLLSFATFWFTVFVKAVKSKISKGAIVLFGTIVVSLVTGLTNNPFHSTKLSVFIIFAIGVGLTMLHEQKKV